LTNYVILKKAEKKLPDHNSMQFHKELFEVEDDLMDYLDTLEKEPKHEARNS